MTALGVNLAPEAIILLGFALGWFAGYLSGSARVVVNAGQGEPPS